MRKFSGRHQISADGKHLIDGVAFGRPFLKRADRPAVRISPRKRRRIILDEEEGDSFVVAEDNDRQVVVRAGFDNADEGDDEDESEDDEDFDPDTADNEGLEDELVFLQDDLQPDEAGICNVARGTRARSTRKGTGLGLDLFADGGYSNPLLDQYSQVEPFAGPSALKIGKTRSKKGRETSTTKNPKSALSPQRVNRSESAGSNKSVRFEEGEAATPVTELAAEDNNNNDDDDDDEDFNPAGLDGSTDFDESDKENTEPVEDATSPFDTSDSSLSSLSDSGPSEDEMGDDDETSSSGTSSSNTESDSKSASDKASFNARKSGNASSSSFTVRNSSDSVRAERGQKPISATEDVKTSASVGEIVTEVKDGSATHPPVPPGSGKQKTRTRNLRRKASAALKLHKANGDLPETATKADFIRFIEQTGTTPHPWMQKLGSRVGAEMIETINDGRDDLGEEQQDTSQIAAKRLVLDLQDEYGNDVTAEDEIPKAVPAAADAKRGNKSENVESKQGEEPANRKASPSVKESKPKQPPIPENSRSPALRFIEAASDSAIVQVPDSLPRDTQPSPSYAVEAQSIDGPLPSFTPPDASGISASVPSGSQKRRAKLDLAGSKRLLFGSLGLKAPKTKDDESALREKLMKDVKPVRPVKERVAEIEAAAFTAAQAENDNDDSWKDKIQLAAVECCHDGVKLSTPPFPFVQRWDPQQQGSYSRKKGRKSKKRKRMDQSYCEENYEESPNPESPSKVARPKNYDANLEQPQFDPAVFEHDQAQQNQGWPYDLSVRDSAAASEQLLRETSMSAANAAAEDKPLLEIKELPDLPSLPEDPTECQELRREHCLAGATIAFKKFLMSAETNWQPKISEYLTAAVRELHEDGTLLMALARRDQPKDEARYDEETGERVYGKFEMPGYDEEHASSDRSGLEMPFDELISPRLIRPASNDQIASERISVPAASDPDDTLVGDEAQRAVTEPHALESLDSTMDNLPGSKAEIIVPTEAAHQDAAGVIQDAGRRSSLRSALGEGLIVNGHVVSSLPEDHENRESPSNQSPSFQDFVSSPHPDSSGSTSPPLTAEFPVSQIPHAPEADAVRDGPNEDSFPSAMSASNSSAQYPTLSQSIEEGELFQNQRQHRSVSLENNLQASSRDFVSPPPVRRAPGQSTLSPIPKPQSQKTAESALEAIDRFDGADDCSDKFPELFSQSFEARISQEFLPNHEPLPNGDTRTSAKGKTGSSQKNKKDSASWVTDLSGLQEEEANNGSSVRPSQSETAQSSEAVDLTVSGDPSDPLHDEAGEMSSYRSSNGWVDKRKANMDIDVTKRSSKRKTRSRSTLAY